MYKSGKVNMGKNDYKTVLRTLLHIFSHNKSQQTCNFASNGSNWYAYECAHGSILFVWENGKVGAKD